MVGGLLYRQTLPIQRLYNEGWNAYHAAALAGGLPLYPPPGAWVANNYPPLSFAAVAALMRLGMDGVFAGRLLAGMSFIGVTALIVAILWARRDAVAALAGGLTFAAYMAINNADYVGLDDPQLLSLAVMLPGLLVLLRVRRRWAAIFAGVAVCLGLFVKHNSVALPIALAAWLLLYDRGALLRYLVTCAVCALGGLAICRAAFGADFFAGLRAPRRYVLTLAARNDLEWVTPMKPLILLALLPAVLDRRDRDAVLFALYLCVALAVGMVEAGGEGVNTNCLFEAVIAFSLGAGCLVGRLSGWLRPLAVIALAVCTAFGPELYDAKDVLTFPSWLAQQRARAAETEAAVAFIAARPGPALCGANPVLCYWAGKPVQIDPFNYGQSVKAGARDEAALIARIDARDFSVIELSSDGPDLFFTPPVLRAVGANYSTAPLPMRHSVLYVPRSN